ncbi:hypothetical protein GCM10022288_22470 [Gryllotalpicola kribbensis]|uniref:FAD/NAD(P)-binding domain-containing protein n=1 Tax=Gryllotalpicola kribbensis TaxID=993084 RepID=A0ABP8AVF3_9MICO
MHSDIAVIGAGPYGLSVAAQLAQRGADARTFGPPMATWRERMPADMLLKSDPFASSLTAGVPGWTLGEYSARVGAPYGDREPRVPLARFCDYGLAFRDELVPDLDERMVTLLTPTSDGYELVLEDGERQTARRVVVAVGITHFAHTPAVLAGLSDRVSHSGDHRTFDRFAGARVAVVGAGSSAVEVTAALVDAGAQSALLARRGSIPFWAAPDPDAQRPSWAERLRNPSTGLGPGWRNKLCEDAPDVFRALPPELRLRIVRNHLGPVSPWWLRETVMAGAEVRTGVTLHGARRGEASIALELSGPDGEHEWREFDHVICATGYQASLDRIPFLDQRLARGLARVGEMPELNRHFESSAPGLFFVGAAAAGSFGPLLRFVVGTEFAAPRVASGLARHASRRRELVAA